MAFSVRRKSNLNAKSRYFPAVTISPPPPSFWSSGGSGNHCPFAIPLTGRIVSVPSLMYHPFAGGSLQPLFTASHPSNVFPSHASFQPSAFSASVSVFAPSGAGFIFALALIVSHTPRS